MTIGEWLRTIVPHRTRPHGAGPRARRMSPSRDVQRESTPVVQNLDRRSLRRRSNAAPCAAGSWLKIRAARIRIAHPPPARSEVIFRPEAQLVRRAGDAMPRGLRRGVPTAAILAETGHQRVLAAGTLRRMKPAHGDDPLAAATRPAIHGHPHPNKNQPQHGGHAGRAHADPNLLCHISILIDLCSLAVRCSACHPQAVGASTLRLRATVDNRTMPAWRR